MKIANLDPTYGSRLGGSTGVASSAAALDVVSSQVVQTITVLDAAGLLGGADPGDLALLAPEPYDALTLDAALAQLAALVVAYSAILGDLALLAPEQL